MGSTEWWKSANCKDVDTEVFYRRGYTRSHLAEAQGICQECVVAGPCLAEELRGGMAVTHVEWAWEQHGFRGGLSASERRRALDAGLSTAILDAVQTSTQPGPWLMEHVRTLPHRSVRTFRI